MLHFNIILLSVFMSLVSFPLFLPTGSFPRACYMSCNCRSCGRIHNVFLQRDCFTDQWCVNCAPRDPVLRGRPLGASIFPLQ